jgi:formiminotetrahydrofolate cyclodeaminase
VIGEISETSVHDFVAALASSAPTPGGGAASALAGALGAALAEMVGQLTVGRAKYRDVEPQVRTMLDQLGAYRAELLRLVDEDAAAYRQVAAAYALPRASDDERAARDAAIQTALVMAMQPPRRIAIVAVDVLRLAGEIAAIGNPSVASDAGCAAVLAEAAVRCAGLNVLANVVLLRDRDAGNAARAELAALEAEAGALRDRGLATVRERMER